MRRWILRVLVVLALLFAGLLAGGRALSKPLPVGESGAAAEQLADTMLAAIDAEGWARTGAIRWTMASHKHLWDRTRSLARVRWGRYEALVVLADGTGRAFKDGVPLEGRAARKAVEKGYSYWVNDAFWLAAPTKVRDDGTSRQLVSTPSGDALLVSYSSGGLTPGDAYLWHLDSAGLPTAWSLWVSIVPIKGARFSWEGWQTLETGAKVSTLHRVEGRLNYEFYLTDVAGAEQLGALEPGPDPFQALNP